MNKKVLIKISIVFIVIGIILFANYKYMTKDQDDYLECTLNSSYANYEEKLTFRFIYDVLYSYTRDEVITSDDINNDIKTFKKIKESAPDVNYFSYTYKQKNNTILVTTFIRAFSEPDFYDDYMTEKDLDFDDSKESVKSELEGQNYTCKMYRK